MSYPSQKRRLRPARGVAAAVAALMAAGAGLAALPSAFAVSPSGQPGTIQTMGGYTNPVTYRQGGYGPEEVAATQSQVSNPRGLNLDSNGNVYFTDALNERVRMIDAAGNIHLVAGNPNPANAAAPAGPATAKNVSATDPSVMFNQPHGVAVSSDGSKVYIADSGNCVIRMVDKATNLITTIAGKGDKKSVPTGTDPNTAKCLGDFIDGPALQSNIDTPKQLFLIKQGGVDWLYITDYGKSTIRKVDVSDPAPQIVTVAGNSQSKTFGGDGGLAIRAQLNHAEGVWVANDGTVYITDGGNNLVRKVDPSGIITTIAGDQQAAINNANSATPSSALPGDDSGDGGLAINAHLDGPRGITGDNMGHLFIAEETGARIRRINLNAPGGPSIDTIAGDGQNSPQGNGQSLIKGENGPALQTEFNFLHDIAYSSSDGTLANGVLWIADSKNNRIRAIVDPAESPGAVVGTYTPPPTQPGPSGCTSNCTPVPGNSKSGYWMLGNDGKVYGFGDAKGLMFGDANGRIPAGAKAVHIEPTPDAQGYWINDDRGGVYAFGDADSTLGGVDPSALQGGEKVTSLSSTPSGHGYWLFTSKGRVFTHGDARSFGDLSALTLNGPVLGSIPTPSGQGYYMVASDGGVFAFGDAKFMGSMGNKVLNKPVEALVPTRDGAGYWLVASDGGIFAFGDAPFKGSMGATPLNKPVVGMVRYGDGYLMVGADGGIFDFSSKPFQGSLGDNPPAHPIVFAATLDF
jgi:sugar lactone lactonase YvrE